MPKQEQPSKSKTHLSLIIVGAGLVILALVGYFLAAGEAAEDPISADIVTFPPIEIDQPAPDLTLTSLDGEQVSLSDFKGSVILVNNWATWCPPCRLEMPEFNTYFNKYQGEGFQVVAVEAGDPEQEVRAFVEENSLDFVVLLDPEQTSLETFQHTSLPNSFVIDRQGNLRLAWLGAINLATLEEYVTPLLRE